MSLRLKLVLWYTGILVLSGGLLTTTLYWLVTHKMRSELDYDLAEEFDEWQSLTKVSLNDLASLEKQIRLEIRSEDRFPLSYRLHDAAKGEDILHLFGPQFDKFSRGLAATVPIEGVPEAPVWSRVWVGERARPFRVLTGGLDRERHPTLVLQVAKYTRLLHKREASIRRGGATLPLALLP